MTRVASLLDLTLGCVVSHDLRSVHSFTDRYVPVFHTKSGLLKATRGIYIQLNSFELL